MSNQLAPAIALWEYRDIGAPTLPLPTPEPQMAQSALPAPIPGVTEEEVGQRIEQALSQARRDWQNSLSALEVTREAQLAQVLKTFAEQKEQYFRHIESEVVHLALAIARKILQREAQMDPDLLSALVHLALDRMGAASKAQIHLPPSSFSHWVPKNKESSSACEVLLDESLNEGDCIVATKFGTTNFGFDSQLKQIEQGLLDLLAHRPGA